MNVREQQLSGDGVATGTPELSISDAKHDQKRRAQQIMDHWDAEKYELLDIEGSGAHATVFKALNTENDRRVAIKVANPLPSAYDQVKHRNSTPEDTLIKETRIFGAYDRLVSRHSERMPDGRPFIVMPYSEKGTASDEKREWHLQSGRWAEPSPSSTKVRRDRLALRVLNMAGSLFGAEPAGKLAVTPVYKKALDVAMGLEELHDEDQVHGDLKDDNILVWRRQGRNVHKLSDYGCTTTTVEGDWQVHRSNMGFPLTRTPQEFLSGSHPTAQADIGSAVNILYKDITGEFLFEDFFLGKLNPSQPFNKLAYHELIADQQKEFSEYMRGFLDERGRTDTAALGKHLDARLERVPAEFGFLSDIIRRGTLGWIHDGRQLRGELERAFDVQYGASGTQNAIRTLSKPLWASTVIIGTMFLANSVELYQLGKQNEMLVEDLPAAHTYLYDLDKTRIEVNHERDYPLLNRTPTSGPVEARFALKIENHESLQGRIYSAIALAAHDQDAVSVLGERRPIGRDINDPRTLGSDVTWRSYEDTFADLAKQIEVQLDRELQHYGPRDPIDLENVVAYGVLGFNEYAAWRRSHPEADDFKTWGADFQDTERFSLITRALGYLTHYASDLALPSRILVPDSVVQERRTLEGQLMTLGIYRDVHIND